LIFEISTLGSLLHSYIPVLLIKTLLTRFRDYLEFIKFSHTIFALPFALIAMMVAAQGWPQWTTVGWILICMVAARTAAMSFNRWSDWQFDQQNPRTRQRATLATRTAAGLVTIISLGLFLWAAGQLNPLCLYLAPLALLLVLGYSLTKRFTAYTHAFLGLALAAAPMGAWAAVTGSLVHPVPWILALAVWSWVFGFDLIYATLDIEFDRQAGLHSFPSRYGIGAALRLALGLHVVTWLSLGAFGGSAGLGLAYWVAWAVVGVLLGYEHLLGRKRDVQATNQAFFTLNAWVSVLLLLGTILGLWIRF
jgi:4-hydroxybenzoate polyprenyltransferase